MKIYLAAGFTVTNVPGKERELCEKFDSWKRLLSYFWMDAIIKSEILTITKQYNENKQTRVIERSGDS